MSTPTRREYATSKYNKMRAYFETHFGACPFPSLEEIDLADVLFLLVHHFSPLYETHDYRKPLRELLRLYITLDEEQLEKHYPHLQKEIDEFLEFMKSQK